MTTDDALKLLGLAREASPEDIRRAYTRLVQQYHPDKVQHLGVEFQQMAEWKTKEINEAYTLLKHYRPEEGASPPPPRSSSPSPPPRQPRRPKAEPTPSASGTPREPGFKAIAIVGAVVVLLLSILLYVNNGGRQSSRVSDVTAKPQSSSYGNPAPTTSGNIYNNIPLMWFAVNGCKEHLDNRGGPKFGIGDRVEDVIRILGPPQDYHELRDAHHNFVMWYADVAIIVTPTGFGGYVAGWVLPSSETSPRYLCWRIYPPLPKGRPRYFGRYSHIRDVMQLEGTPRMALADFGDRNVRSLRLDYVGGSVTVDGNHYVSDYTNRGGLHTDDRDESARYELMLADLGSFAR